MLEKKELSPTLSWALNMIKEHLPEQYDEAVAIVRGWGIMV